MDLPELPRRIYTLGEEPTALKSISYHTDDLKLLIVVRQALHAGEYEELKDSKLGVFIKFKELNFVWASRLVHYMLSFQLNIKKKYELWSLITKEVTSFWEMMGVDVDAGPIAKQIIAAYGRCEDWSWEDHMRLGYLAIYLSIFTGFIEGRKYSTSTRASPARLVMDLEVFENYL
ncbi:BnaC02g26260D [Brassica napus]|uniref:BnaC02g26260D protein n=1 Tax=Brassica napus TaxID=3708 RepID=A0A078H4N1_BRANA|nr:BnaC02g26260D [Brassica napus]